LQVAHASYSLAIRKWPGLNLHIISILLSNFISWQDMFSPYLESFTSAFCAKAPEAENVN
ncbi:MAG: hypothetical protein OEV22_16005, partial [Deltaproteobacteria bacterium]|nr:hypothetical protein [Deltaproteobacteria bacterium]